MSWWVRPRHTLQPNDPTRNLQNSVTAGLASARAEGAIASTVRFPGEDGGRSLAEMAQRDLDAALQLLADRAQFITGASGAAIALRRDGMKDMLCRASAGSNAPELGALLSTEFGLSGESVRTRQLLRCDDAERDARVNREVCRQLGIASVVVMPVVNDDEVLGVFELFSGQANAFGDRDLSAVQRLSQMVETAVRLAQVTQSLPEQLKTSHGSTLEAPSSEATAQVSDDQILEVPVTGSAPTVEAATAALADEPVLAVTEVAAQAPRTEATAFQAVESPQVTEEVKPDSAEVETPQKPRLWSAAESLESGAENSGESDQSHVPPVLRGLRKCDACGFPISSGRVLCVECEEKKWRGQLKSPVPTGSVAAAASVQKIGQTFAAAAQSAAGGSAVPATPPKAAASPVSMQPGAGPTVAEPKESSKIVTSAADDLTAGKIEPERIAQNTEGQSPDVVLSAGLEPSQSWLSRNKYVLGALLLVAVVLTVVFLLR